MQQPQTHCLFDRWQELSPPVLHSSELWPEFNEASIARFLAGDDESPVASRPLNSASALAAKQQIEHFLHEIESLDEAGYPCKAEYAAFERERLAQLTQMLQAGDSKAVAEANDALYGRLPDMHSDAALAYLKHSIQAVIPKSAVVAAWREQLLGSWQDVQASTEITKLFGRFDACRVQLRPFVQRRFHFVEELLAPYKDVDSYDAATAQRILSSALGPLLGSYSVDWRAVVQDGAPNVFIDHTRRVVAIPAGRQFTKEHLTKLIVHEIGVHVARGVRGKHSQERLAGYGMASYNVAEEALGVFVQDVRKDRYDYLHDLAAFAAIDAAGRPGATFRSVFAVSQAVFGCLRNPDEAAYASEASGLARRAFGMTIRLLRMGDTSVVDRSIAKYWYGYFLLADFLESRGLSQEVFDELFEGKCNPLNARQLFLIRSHNVAVTA